jgi:phage pi2 protein 07
MKIYTIYKATNTINGKSYVGFDSCWPKRKEKIGNSWKGKKHSEETKKKMSETRKKFVFTPEICKKISISKIGVKRGPYKKTIEQRIR